MEVFLLCCFFPCFNFEKAVGVCFLVVCDGTYSAVLVFCFLRSFSVSL